MASGIRVLLTDDHGIVRDGLKSLIGRQPDIEVVGEASDGRQAISLARELSPDVVVMDIGMDGLNGIEATKLITKSMPNVRIVALSMHADERYVTEMLEAGASAYLLKEGAFTELVSAIRAVAEGNAYFSRGVADVVLNGHARRGNSPQELDSASPARGLSAREREVLKLIAEGMSTKEIAAHLHLSVKTVETYRRQIMEKLGIFNVAGLIKFAVREGLASLEG